MSQPVYFSDPMTRTAIAQSHRMWLLVAMAAMLVPAAFMVPNPISGILLFGLACSLLFLATAVRYLAARHENRQRTLLSQVGQFVEHDASPSFMTHEDGEITYCNGAAKERFKDLEMQTLGNTLAGLFANPAAILFRLQQRCQSSGFARDDVVTRNGHIRMSVHRVSTDGYLWRLEDIADRTPNSQGAEGLSLPMMTVSKSDTILFMNEALRRLLGGRVKSLDRVFNHLPMKVGALNEVQGVEGPVQALIAETHVTAGRREVFFLPAETAALTGPSSWAFFDELPVPLLKIAKGGEVVLSNRLSRDLLQSEIPPGTQLAELVEGLGRSVGDWLTDAIEGRSPGRGEVLRARNPETDVFLQISLGRIRDDDGAALVAVLNDATELKSLEIQFVQSQKMQAIGQLAGGVAHDFNNLLTAISGHCDLLLLRHDQGDPDYGDLVQINQNANRAASLVGQLLAFSRKQNLQPELLDMRDTLSDLTHLLNRLVGERIALSLSHDPELLPIRADKRQLEQVLMNLVVNARDAMAEGGEITVTTENVLLEKPMKRDRAEVAAGRYVVVRVSDQGTGIAPDKMPKIFEPFYTTKRTGEGTGLGLSTAYGIIKQTGGFIFVDSVPGQGTVFTLYFPAHDRPVLVEAPQVKKAAPKVAAPGEGVVLLVEDEAPVRAFASRALRLRGYTVLEAENAEEALKTLEDAALWVDIFVTDVIMPGMDGPSWVREALKDRPDVKVVFVSGYAEDAFEGGKEEIPNSVFLPKPFSLNDLTSTVQEQLH